ncbi:MAG: sulfatase [Candidatus Omnitrophica bacterium]|nr:sulfatase [Candidatus Omnitrophota bacterium]
MSKKSILSILIVLFLILALSLYYIGGVRNPNILIVTIDALRPDHLGCYGYSRDTSANIDSLAASGAIFKQAISQATWTHPSNCAFFTSSYPYMHIIGGESYLNPDKTSLAKALNKSGYKTIFITDYPTIMNRITGFKEQFNNYTAIEEDNPKNLTKLALDILRKNSKSKFLLWVYYFGTHEQYGDFSDYSRYFYQDGLLESTSIEMQPDYSSRLFGVIPKYLQENDISDPSYYIAKYDGRLKLIDDQIGLIIDKLKELNLYKNTLIVILSDHGESLGENNLYFQHTNNLYDSSLRVPLLLHYPGLIAPGTVVTKQVGLIDVMPTILDILKIRCGQNLNIEGKSMVPLILKGHSIRPYVFSELDGWIFSVRSESHKLIYIDRRLKKDSHWLEYYKNDYELYDLKNDPLERVNLIFEQQEMLMYLREKLDQYVGQARAYQDRLSQEINFDTDIKDEQAKEKLRSLGYF